MVGPETEVSVTGTAEQDYLKSGVTVEFVAEVDKTHTVKEKIVKLLIVSPTTERPVGLFAPEFATPSKSEKGEKGGEGVKPLPPDPGSATRRRPRDEGGRQEGSRSVRRRSVGQQARQNTEQRPAVSRHVHRAGNDQDVQGRQDHRLGRPRPDDQGRIGQRRHDRRRHGRFRVAQPDDQVTVDGFASQAQPNMVMAKSIKIELANPLSGAKKHGRTPRPRPRTPPRRRRTPPTPTICSK